MLSVLTTRQINFLKLILSIFKLELIVMSRKALFGVGCLCNPLVVINKRPVNDVKCYE